MCVERCSARCDLDDEAWETFTLNSWSAAVEAVRNDASVLRLAVMLAERDPVLIVATNAHRAEVMVHELAGLSRCRRLYGHVRIVTLKQVMLHGAARNVSARHVFLPYLRRHDESLLREVVPVTAAYSIRPGSSLTYSQELD